MYNVTSIQSIISGLVGFENPIDPEYGVVNTENQAASSGRYFTDNTLVKIPFLMDTQDYADISDEQFNEFLAKIKEKASSNVMDRIFNESDYIDSQLLYQNANNKIDTETLPDGFVGYEIQVDRSKNFTFEIKRCILEFSGVGDVELLIYNTAKKEPIFNEVVNVSSSLQEVELNWKLDNTNTFYKGKYYFGYQTDGVVPVPYKRDYENSSVISCISGIELTPISVTYSPTSNELFDLTDIDNESECWGLNPEINVYSDYTNFIIQNNRIFAKAIQYSGQIYCISYILNSLRSNRNQRISEDVVSNMVIDIEGSSGEVVKKKGLRAELADEILRLSDEVKRMHKSLFATGLTLGTRS